MGVNSIGEVNVVDPCFREYVMQYPLAETVGKTNAGVLQQFSDVLGRRTSRKAHRTYRR